MRFGSGEYSNSIETEPLMFSSLIACKQGSITGFLWYGQFFFYNLGHVRLGEKFAFTSWAIHMIMLVLFSNVVGLLLLEWRGCRRIMRATLGLALLVLVAAVLLLTYGNKVGG
jgi:L-rhamnose-H+ transport protein